MYSLSLLCETVAKALALLSGLVGSSYIVVVMKKNPCFLHL